LLATAPNFDNVVAISSNLGRPQDRFLLLGGLDGFLREMRERKIDPDVRMFSQMLHMTGDSEGEENELIERMDKEGVPIDAGFVNQLIKKRAFRWG
jgi:pentatricopeptide repeat domain-containing protein 1